MADVYERTPKKWYLRGRVNGKRIHIFVATTKSEALAALKDFLKRKALDDLDLPDLPKKKQELDISFEELAIRYMDHSAAEKSKNSYIGELKRVNCHWLPLFKGRMLSQITSLEIQKWKEKRLNSGIKTFTVHNDLKVLKTMFSRAKNGSFSVVKTPLESCPKPFVSRSDS